MSALELAKQALLLPDLMARLGLGEHAERSAHCPFHDDGNKSFSIFHRPNGEWAWKCFAGCGHGDAIDFLQRVTGLSKAEACRSFIEMAGTGDRYSVALPVSVAPANENSRPKPAFPAMRPGTREELASLARLRTVSVEACLLANTVGLLRYGEWYGTSAWLVTDDERLNAQSRRIDGAQWEQIGAKAQTLPGSWAGWPLGIKTGQHYPIFLLCEGGPDLLAALHFIHLGGRETECFPIGMLGGSQRIHEEALPFFTNKRVRIYAHADEEGQEAAERWAAQLQSVSAEVDCPVFTGLRKADGSVVNDLNDCTSIHPDDANELEGLLPE